MLKGVVALIALLQINGVILKFLSYGLVLIKLFFFALRIGVSYSTEKP